MGEIPGFPAGTVVSYKVIAYDYAGNFAIEDNMGNLYTYTVISEFPTMLTPLIFIILILVGLVTIFIIKNKNMLINKEKDKAMYTKNNRKSTMRGRYIAQTDL